MRNLFSLFLLLAVLLVGCRQVGVQQTLATEVKVISLTYKLNLYWDTRAKICVLSNTDGGLILVDHAVCQAHGLTGGE